MSTRPIFVAGSARSGTTLLQSALGAHNRIAAPPELHFVSRISSLADYYGDLHDDGALARALHDTLDLVLLDQLQLDAATLLVEAKQAPRTYAGLMSTVMGHVARRWGKTRWSDKTPWQPPVAAWHLFPDAQVIHIVRDPRDMVASSVEAAWIHEHPRELAVAWRRFNSAAARQGADAGPSRYHFIRYEDLVADPGAVLRVVCAFLGEEFAPAMLSPRARGESGSVVAGATWQANVAMPIETSRVHRYSDVLTLRDRCLIAPVIQREVAVLGYEAPRRRAVVVGRLLRPLELPHDAVRAVHHLRMRRRLAPAQRHAEVAKFFASGTQTASPLLEFVVNEGADS